MKSTPLLRFALAVFASAFLAGTATAAFAPNPNDIVRATLPLPDGDILVGGDFNQIDGAAHNAIARLNADGSADASFVAGANARVRAIVRQADGKILIGGDFSQVNGIARQALARLNADGSLDASFASPSFSSADSASSVGAILVQSDGKILVVGGGIGFDSVNGEPRPGLARLNPDGSLDASFTAAQIGMDASARVFSAALQADGKIVVGGNLYVGGNGFDLQQAYLARLSPEGTLDATFPLNGPGGTVNGLVSNLLVQGDGAIVLIGRFSTPYRHVARVGADGNLDGAFDVGGRSDVSEEAVVIQQNDGKLLIGSVYPTPAIIRLDPDGASDASFADPRIVYNIVFSLALQADGKVLVGGYFQEVGGYPRNNLALLNADGSIYIPDYTVTPAPGPNGSLSPATSQAVREGETTRFLIQPDAGYRLESIGGCDGSVDGAYYVTGPIHADCTVAASFTTPEQTFTVSTHPIFGSFSPSEPQTVRFGQTARFVLTPNAGYYINTVSGCGGTLEGDTYTTAPIAADCSIATEFVAPRGATLGGTPQATGAGTGFATPLTVRVLAGYPNMTIPVQGVEVHFEGPANGAGALLSAATATTDANGNASVTAVANGIGGSYAVKAVVTGLESTPFFFTLTNETLDGPGIELKVTLSTEPPPACGASNSLEVTPGTPINYCFTVTNRTSATLNYHSLQHSPWTYFWTLDSDQAMYLKPLAIPAQGTARYHITVAATADSMDEQFVWTAFAGTPNYRVDTEATEAFVDISGTGTAVNSESLGVTDLPMPFPLTFFGTTFRPESGDLLCVGNSGTLRLVPGFYAECPSMANHVRVPPFVGDNVQTDSDFTDGILPYWDLLGYNGVVYVQTVGEAPNRHFIVQWNEKDHASLPNPTNGITFEAIIEEGSDTIRYVYRDLDFDDPSAPALSYGGSAGIGLFGTNLELDDIVDIRPPLHDGQSIVLTPSARPHIATAATRLQVGTPRIQAPASIAASAPRQQSVTRTLDIANTGNLALEWSLDRAATTAHFPETPRWVPSPEQSGLTYRPSALSSGWTSPNHARRGQTAAAYDVPAYGAMRASTANDLGNANYVTFNANHPTELTPMLFNAVGTQGGDFIRDDFSKQYILYGDNDGDVPYLVVLDHSDFSANFIGAPLTTTPPNGQRLSGLAWDRSTATLFASSATKGGQGQPCDEQYTFGQSALYTIDPDSGEQHTIGEIGFDDGSPLCVTDIAVSPSGLMYGIDLLNDALVAIDKTNGRAALIGSLGFDIQLVNSIDFDDATGVLYLAAGYYPAYDANVGGIYTIDLATGLAQRIAFYPPLVNQVGYLQVDALSIARAGGACAYPGEIPWLRFDVDSGSTAPGQQSPITLTLDAGSLDAGDYTANVCISSNDRSQSLLAVPVAFTVTAGPGGDAIFRNGFDGATH